MPRPLILGNGYIGSNLAAFLEAKKVCHQVLKVSASNLNSNKLIDEIDLDEFNQLYWCIGYNSPIGSLREICKSNYANITLPSLLIERLVEKKFSGKIIFFSTRLVYDDVSEPAEEFIFSDSPIKTPYALSKKYIEQLAYILSKHSFFQTKIIRLGVPYGSISGKNFKAGTVEQMVAAGKNGAITVYDDGSQKRTFTHISDLLEFCEYVVNDGKKYEIVNCPGENLSILDISELIADKFNAKIEFKKYPPLYAKTESQNTHFSMEISEKKYGYHPKMNFSNWINSDEMS